MQETPLIIQSDRTMLLDVHSPSAAACRNDIVAFSELVKSPEHVHTFALTAISLWNAVSAGLTVQEIEQRLKKWSRFDVPENVLFFIRDMAGRFGSIVLRLPADEQDTEHYELYVSIPRHATEIRSRVALSKLLMPSGHSTFLLSRYNRGEVKLQLVKLGFPVDDRVPLTKGEPVPFSLVDVTKSGKPFVRRDYQRLAADTLVGDGGVGTGYGTIVLPCGSGKTIVGMEVMSRLQTRTLILTTNVAAVHQWIAELLDKTDLDPSLIGEYTGERKQIRPITVCTYQVLTWRKDKTEDFPHMQVLKEGNWGLIVYDEVHTLPAPVFKVTAELQAVHRVGLTATLIREDGREDEVFSLVGPKRFDVPWSELESQGWIAQAMCHEIRIPLPLEMEVPYALASNREKYRIASENPKKMDVIRELVDQHPEDYILIIGQYIDQLKEVSKEFGLPLITGTTSNAKRDELFGAFRRGEQRILVVSKVANFAIDLPDASMAIQISGTFGSRQEEAQRLGRILRPKERTSNFYTLVSRYTSEEDFSANRQKFLAEQGYAYSIEVYDGT